MTQKNEIPIRPDSLSPSSTDTFFGILTSLTGTGGRTFCGSLDPRQPLSKDLVGSTKSTDNSTTKSSIPSGGSAPRPERN
ncbi:hypothetical protein MTO96_040828 [Rhipicephalus appendiculatus]